MNHQIHFMFACVEGSSDPLTIPPPPVRQDSAEAGQDPRQPSLPLEIERHVIRAWRAVET